MHEYEEWDGTIMIHLGFSCKQLLDDDMLLGEHPINNKSNMRVSAAKGE